MIDMSEGAMRGFFNDRIVELESSNERLKGELEAAYKAGWDACRDKLRGMSCEETKECENERR